MPKRALSPAIRRSQQVASSRPPPTHRPLIAAITGCRQPSPQGLVDAFQLALPVDRDARALALPLNSNEIHVPSSLVWWLGYRGMTARLSRHPTRSPLRHSDFGAICIRL